MELAYICETCGCQYTPSARPPKSCMICDDDRQYVGHQGQRWLTYPQLKSTHKNLIREVEPSLFGIGVEPRFAIGQRALMVPTERGNILWDCVPLLDQTAYDFVISMGGLAGIALSHPHYYSAIVEWSHAFDKVPVYIHESDQAWITRMDPVIELWRGPELQLAPGATLINCGGHFPGSALLHWQAGAAGKGCLFTGDSIYVTADRRYVSFMHSFPNLIPLPAGAIQRIVNSVAPYAFDRIYAAWFDTVVRQDAKAALEFSAKRYMDALKE